MALSAAQQQTLANDIRANTNQVVIDALNIRDDVAITDFYNSATSTMAWRTAVSTNELFENTQIAQFDTLSAGKREAWSLIVNRDFIDATRGKIRQGINDVWKSVNTQPETHLLLLQEPATVAEVLFGGPTRQTTAKNQSGDVVVTGIKRKWTGRLTVNEVSIALNKYKQG